MILASGDKYSQFLYVLWEIILNDTNIEEKSEANHYLKKPSCVFMETIQIGVFSSPTNSIDKKNCKSTESIEYGDSKVTQFSNMK